MVSVKQGVSGTNLISPMHNGVGAILMEQTITGKHGKHKKEQMAYSKMCIYQTNFTSGSCEL